MAFKISTYYLDRYASGTWGNHHAMWNTTQRSGKAAFLLICACVVFTCYYTYFHVTTDDDFSFEQESFPSTELGRTARHYVGFYSLIAFVSALYLAVAPRRQCVVLIHAAG